MKVREDGSVWKLFYGAYCILVVHFLKALNMQKATEGTSCKARKLLVIKQPHPEFKVRVAQMITSSPFLWFEVSM